MNLFKNLFKGQKMVEKEVIENKPMGNSPYACSELFDVIVSAKRNGVEMIQNFKHEKGAARNFDYFWKVEIDDLKIDVSSYRRFKDESQRYNVLIKDTVTDEVIAVGGTMYNGSRIHEQVKKYIKDEDKRLGAGVYYVNPDGAAAKFVEKVITELKIQTEIKQEQNEREQLQREIKQEEQKKQQLIEMENRYKEKLVGGK